MNPPQPQQPTELEKIIDTALSLIKPVLKPDNGTGIMHMDSARLLLKMDLEELLARFAAAIDERMPVEEDPLTAPGSTDREIEIWNKAVKQQRQSLQAVLKEFGVDNATE